jgi:lysophospholipase L1-like esterase
VNDAIAGRSARSYTREGRFNNIAGVLKAGDWVIIEFGHNDGGAPKTDGTVRVFVESTSLKYMLIVPPEFRIMADRIAAEKEMRPARLGVMAPPRPYIPSTGI